MVKKHYNFVATARAAKKQAKAIIANANASLKYSTEFCREIKGRPLAKAESFVRDVLEHRRWLPLRAFKKKVAHRKGDAQSGVKAGRFPEKTARVFLKLLESVKANADYKGLDTEKLLLVHAFASQGFARVSFQTKGQIGGKRRKKPSVHLEVVVQEMR
jgi:large subunit ribosomal protein L22